MRLSFGPNGQAIPADTATRTTVGRLPSMPIQLSLTTEDWQLMLTSRANVLAVGSERAIDALLHAWLPHLEAPLAWWQGDTATTPAPDVRTIMLNDPADLSADQQAAVLKCLGERSVRIISMSPQPLHNLVANGRFVAILYYALNTIYVVL